jgi:hypothetical protein
VREILPDLAIKLEKSLSKGKNKRLEYSKYRLIGRQAIQLEKNFHLFDQYIWENFQKKSIWDNSKRIATFLLALYTRRLNGIYASKETSFQLIELAEFMGRNYYNLHVLYFSSDDITPTVFTMGVIMPYFFRKNVEQFGIGMGISGSLQPFESFNHVIKNWLENTNFKLNEKDKWEQIFENAFLLQDYLAKTVPISEEEFKDTWISRENYDPMICICGIQKEDMNVKRCKWCLKYVLPFEKQLENPIEFQISLQKKTQKKLKKKEK